MPDNQTDNEAFDELATLKEIERAIRAFRKGYFEPINQQDSKQFHPGTKNMMAIVSPLLNHLDEGRGAQKAQQSLVRTPSLEDR